MKRNLLAFAAFVLLLLACRQTPADSPTAIYLNRLSANPQGEPRAILVLNPSFCGSCNASTLELIRLLDLPKSRTLILMSSANDEIESTVSDVSDFDVLYPEYESLEKHGLVGPYSRLLIVNGNQLVYDNKIIPEQADSIRLRLRDFKTAVGANE